MKLIDKLLLKKARIDMACATGSLVSSRVRLARNLEGIAFPGWAGEEESRRVWLRLRAALQSLCGMSDSVAAEMTEVDEVGRELLVERHLISREMAEKGPGSGIVVDKDERVSIMVNEEDHLRIQSMSSGLDLIETWRLVDRLDSEIEGKVKYAFSSRLGYLSACPTNVGTGMRASVMMHLPGLSLMNEIKPIINGVSKMGMAVRGLWGEGSDAAGNMFQVSNQATLGESEETIIRKLEQIVLELVEHERNVRKRLVQQKEMMLRDRVGRAIGLLTHAELLDSAEALTLLSNVRLGLELGIINEWSRSVIDELFILVQPGHLQKYYGRQADAKQRDILRASLVRERLALEAGDKGAS